MSTNEFGGALAEAVGRKLEDPVSFVAGTDFLQIGQGEKKMQVNLASFLTLHRHGRALEDIADQVADVWRSAEPFERLSWDRIQEQLIPHLVRTESSYESLLVRKLSPFLGLSLAVDTPSDVRIMNPSVLEEWGVSTEDAMAVAQAHMDRILAAHPGEDTELGGQPVKFFGGDLAADRAYAFVRSLPAATVCFVAPDLAVVATDPGSLPALVRTATLDFEELIHRFPPAIHGFENGTVAWAGWAVVA